MVYSIEEHRHRFAAWAAGRAANVNGCRFTVEQGKKLLEAANLNTISKSINNLPPPNEFDDVHREWRNIVIKRAENLQLTFTHGVAAKLINIYLKSIFVCGNSHIDPRVNAIHPPIDSLLLDSLYKQNIGGRSKDWQAARRIRWSKLNSEQYEGLISAIQDTVSVSKGLWRIEEYWPGYR